MPIDIDRLSREELIDLNHRIVERLRFLDQAKQHQTMLQFSIGDTVCFEDKYGDTQIGKLIKYNKKTVSILTEEGARWNVSPGLLSRVKEAPPPPADPQSKLIELDN